MLIEATVNVPAGVTQGRLTFWIRAVPAAGDGTLEGQSVYISAVANHVSFGSSTTYSGTLDWT